eukprot:1362914-Pleurochrysis_carterae.AAC.1
MTAVHAVRPEFAKAVVRSLPAVIAVAVSRIHANIQAHAARIRRRRRRRIATRCASAHAAQAIDRAPTGAIDHELRTLVRAGTYHDLRVVQRYRVYLPARENAKKVRPAAVNLLVEPFD